MEARFRRYTAATSLKVWHAHYPIGFGFAELWAGASPLARLFDLRPADYSKGRVGRCCPPSRRSACRHGNSVWTRRRGTQAKSGPSTLSMACVNQATPIDSSPHCYSPRPPYVSLPPPAQTHLALCPDGDLSSAGRQPVSQCYPSPLSSLCFRLSGLGLTV